LRRAQVRAVATAQRATRLTSTDPEGRYEFTNLPAGRYTVTVSKAGYVGLEFGQRRPFEGGRPLDLTEGQTLESIDFALPLGGVITGRITDEAGDPIVGAYVQAMRYRFMPEGRRQLTPVTGQFWLSNITNDLGEYRLFGLMPGTYIVSAHAQNMGIVSVTQAPQSGGVASINTADGYIQTYFPGSGNVAESRPVQVDLSEETPASFSLLTGRMSRISGTVRKSDGSPATGFQVHLRPGDTSGAAMGGWGASSVAADGSFSLANVPPGEFTLEVLPTRPMVVVGDGLVTRGAPDPSAAQEFARMPLSVGGGEIAGVTITTRPGSTLAGRVVFPGKIVPGTSPGGGPRVEAAPADAADQWTLGMLQSSRTGTIDGTGRFELRGVSGRVLLRAAGLPANLVLKSVSLSGADITDRPYDTSRGDAADIVMVVAEQAQLDGIAKSARGEAMRDFRVALFPATAKPGPLTTRFMHTASADPNGRFHISRLPAGEYLGVAVESFDVGTEWDPAFQQRVLPATRRFSLREGQTLTIELPFVE
jgi:hypothetical protein